MVEDWVEVLDLQEQGEAAGTTATALSRAKVVPAPSPGEEPPPGEVQTEQEHDLAEAKEDMENLYSYAMRIASGGPGTSWCMRFKAVSAEDMPLEVILMPCYVTCLI